MKVHFPQEPSCGYPASTLGLLVAPWADFYTLWAARGHSPTPLAVLLQELSLAVPTVCLRQILASTPVHRASFPTWDTVQSSNPVCLKKRPNLQVRATCWASPGNERAQGAQQDQQGVLPDKTASGEGMKLASHSGCSLDDMGDSTSVPICWAPGWLQ